jgi:hypothetical protein
MKNINNQIRSQFTKKFRVQFNEESKSHLDLKSNVYTQLQSKLHLPLLHSPMSLPFQLSYDI